MERPIVIVGGNGQLGSDLLGVGRAQDRAVTGLSHADIDITNAVSVAAALNERKPAVVINTAAAHGPQQSTAADQTAFYSVNALGVWHLARWCWANGAVLVHYSTDYVFGAETTRTQPYTEADAPCPTTLYGSSKVAGELLVKAFCPAHYIVRIASVYGAVGARAKNNSNFVLMALGKIQRGENMQVVNDQWMSPTWTKAAALKTFEMLDARVPYGLYHLAGSGACTWYDFACEIVRLTGGKITVEPATTPANKPSDLFLRPRYTALDNASLRATGLNDMPDWHDGLAEHLRLNAP